MEHIQTLIQGVRPETPITLVKLPDGENLNSIWLNYGTEGILQLINDAPREKIQSNRLVISETKIHFEGKAGAYYIQGNLPMDLGNMRISLVIIANESPKKHRLKIDLFETSNVQYQCKQLSEVHGFDSPVLESDLEELTELLEEYRESLFNEENNPITEQYSQKELTPRAGEKAMEFLSKPQLFQNIDNLLGQAGIIGEENNRKVLFIVASSHKMPYPLHAMVQASSGSGKSHLINSIASCIPQEDLYDSTSITSKALYYCTDKQLNNKLMVIQDFDGLDEDARLAFREIQSYKSLRRTTTGKNAVGILKSLKKEVKASLASMVATTKSEIYEDNENRTIMLGIDESTEQTLRIIQRQNRQKAGVTNTDKEFEAKQLLRNCMRILKSRTVVNPYADQLQLPLDAKSLRRLNEQFQDFVCQIVILHQYQRNTDSKGRLVATKEDIRLATEIFFDAIILKVDELNGSLRQFFDRLKAYVRKQPSGSTHKFNQRDIRQEMKLSKTPASNYMKQLQELEYIQVVDGTSNTGFRYVISFWDTMEKEKVRIKADLNSQLERL